MRIYRQLADLPANFGPSVATIGNFDGVHRGHQWVIAEVVARARELNQTSVAITFDPHPARVLRPNVALPLITPTIRKLELLEATGIDATGGSIRAAWSLLAEAGAELGSRRCGRALSPAPQRACLVPDGR